MRKRLILLWSILTLLLTCQTLQHQVQELPADVEIDYSQVRAINRKTDPAYIYPYEKTKFVPPQGKILYIGGQEKHDIPKFINGTGLIPGGLASYIAVTSKEGMNWDSQDHGAGIQNIGFLVENYSNTVLQIAYWLVGTWDIVDKTVEGSYDQNIDYFSEWAKSVDRPIYFRIGYEFDGPHNELEPDKYVKTYRYIVDRIRAAGVTNIAYVWHSYAAPPYQGHDVMEWYPGDDYVDWFAVSLFGHFYQSAGPNFYLDQIVDLARDHKKPVMIAEAQPGGRGGGIRPNSYETWNNWFVNTLNYIYEKNIKAFSYISCDMDSYAMFKSFQWGDSRIQKYPIIRKLWIEEMAKEQYLKASETLFKDLGYIRVNE